jgi:DNA-binding CsgD family transcriptional regulator
VTFVDAPVSGSKGPAEQGQLLILASGPEAAASQLRLVFDTIGRKTVWLGQVGQGSIVKLVVNAYMSILVEGVAEATDLADRLGIGRQQLADVIEGGPLDAPLADAKLHKMDRGDYAPEFPLEWALKDVDLAISAAGGEAPPLLAAQDVTEFVRSLQRVAGGGAVIDPALVQELVRSRQGHDPLDMLSAREREVLALMAEGRSNAGIARQIWIAEATAEKHVHSILGKLDLPDSSSDHRRVLAVLAYLSSTAG